MKYKIIQSNSDVNVIEVDGTTIQLSASICIDDYLNSKYGLLAADDKPKTKYNLRQKNFKLEQTTELTE